MDFILILFGFMGLIVLLVVALMLSGQKNVKAQAREIVERGEINDLEKVNKLLQALYTIKDDYEAKALLSKLETMKTKAGY